MSYLERTRSWGLAPTAAPFIAGHCFFSSVEQSRTGSLRDGAEQAKATRDAVAHVYDFAPALYTSFSGYITEATYSRAGDDPLSQSELYAARSDMMKHLDCSTPTANLWHYNTPLDFAALVLVLDLN